MSETATTEQSPDADAWTTERWVYAGMTAQGGKQYNTFRRADDLAGPRLSYLRKRGRSFVVGGIYEVEAKGDSARLQGASWVGTLEDTDVVAGWIAADRAAQATAQGEAAEKAAQREAGETLAQMTLGQARTFIANGPYATQAARTAVILKALGL